MLWRSFHVPPRTSQSNSGVLIYHSEFVAMQLSSRTCSSLSKAAYRTSGLDCQFSSVWDRIDTIWEAEFWGHSPNWPPLKCQIMPCQFGKLSSVMFLVTFFSREMHDKNKNQTWKIAGVGAMPNKHLNKICISKIKAVYKRVDAKCSMTNHQGQL